MRLVRPCRCRPPGLPARLARRTIAAPALAVLALAGCDTGHDAGHLGNPLTLPLRGAGTALANAAYNARRARVQDYVLAHHAVLIAEIAAGSGPHLDSAADLAGVPPAARAPMIRQMAHDVALYRHDPEMLTIALTVHGA